MRIKTFGMLAASGILTAAFAYAVPAIADDTTAADTGAPATQTAPNANAADDQNIASPSDNNNTANSAANDNDTTADTPSGDDDY